MGSRRSSRISEKEKSLLKDLIKGKNLIITNYKNMDIATRHKQREMWNKIAAEFNAAGIGKVRNPWDLKNMVKTSRISTEGCALQEHGSQDAHGIRLNVELSQALDDTSKLPLHTDVQECESEDAQSIRQKEEMSQDLADKANLPPLTDGIIGSHLSGAGLPVVSEDGQQTFAEVPVQPFTADEEFAATDIDTKEGILSPPVERKLWQAQLKMLETQAKIEQAQLKSLERQARIEEAQLLILKRQAKIEEAQLRCLERQAKLNEAKLKAHDKKAKIEETHLRNLERQAKIDESQLNILQSQTKIEESKSRILEGQVDMDALLQRISQHVQVIASYCEVQPSNKSV